jgi:hypothetical protein
MLQFLGSRYTGEGHRSSRYRILSAPYTTWKMIQKAKLPTIVTSTINSDVSMRTERTFKCAIASDIFSYV